MKMTNLEIYQAAQNYNQAFIDFNEYLPVRVNFFMQKNKDIIIALAKDIDNARMEILYKYGTMSEEGDSFIISPESVDVTNKELNDLFAIEQDVAIHKINLSAFDDIKLTTNQVQAIMFMIDEEQA